MKTSTDTNRSFEDLAEIGERMQKEARKGMAEIQAEVHATKKLTPAQKRAADLCGCMAGWCSDCWP